MNAVNRHATLCLLAGQVTILPIGGTVILVFAAENFLHPLVPAGRVLLTDWSIDQARERMLSLGRIY